MVALQKVGLSRSLILKGHQLLFHRIDSFLLLLHDLGEDSNNVHRADALPFRCRHEVWHVLSNEAKLQIATFVSFVGEFDGIEPLQDGESVCMHER